jgi:hypothetical protein
MPGLSFSGVPKRGPFWWQIITGQKIQTCREPRVRPFKDGDTLYLYWKMRTPKTKKPIHHIGNAIARPVLHSHYRNFAYDNDFAKRDGFEDYKELQEWFGDPDGFIEEEIAEGLSIQYRRHALEYTVVIWNGSLELSEEAKKILSACKIHPAFPDFKAYTEIFGTQLRLKEGS